MKITQGTGRRKFIRNLSIGFGALAGYPALTSLAACTNANQQKEAENQKKGLGIALIGLGGYSSGQLAPALQETKNCYLAGIVTGTPAKEQEWAGKYNIAEKNIYNYNNFDKIADNKDIDIIYVVLPISMHKEFTIRGAKAGKHVICEKPMALNATECTEMIAACNQANKMLSIGYRLHFEPHNQEIMRLGQKQVYGKLTDIDTGNGFVYGGDPNAWRLKKALAGGGALMDMGVYAIQAARYTTGKEPVSVKATEEKTNTNLFKEVDETIFWELEFEDGLIAKGKSSYNNNWGFNKVKAEKGQFGLEPSYAYGGITGYNKDGALKFPQVNQQALQMDDFASCIMNNKQTRVPGEEGLKDMKVIDAIYKSIASGKREAI